MHPEWHEQQAIIVTWPHQHSDWGMKTAEIDACYKDLVITVASYQPVIVLCYDDEHQQHITSLLAPSLSKINHPPTMTVIPTNDTWIRDYGPLRIQAGNDTKLLNAQFNAWGGKYHFDLDNQVCHRLAKQGLLPYPMVESELVLEGGAIDSNGAGAILTTSKCLLNPSRNGATSPEEMTKTLQELLGVQKIHWLQYGYLAGDDTDSHVDMLARFVSESHIVFQSCTDPSDEHYLELAKMAEALEDLESIHGKPYQLTPLPWPRAKYDGNERLPASYANFLIINKAVLVPIYQDPADAAALAIIQDCFPDYAVHGINCLPLIKQRGSLHCATIQI